MSSKYPSFKQLFVKQVTNRGVLQTGSAVPAAGQSSHQQLQTRGQPRVQCENHPRTGLIVSRAPRTASLLFSVAAARVREEKEGGGKASESREAAGVGHVIFCL